MAPVDHAGRHRHRQLALDEMCIRDRQDVVRLVRDVRVNTELYTGLLNNAQQLRLIRAGKVGNVRILDAAVQPDKPVRPKAAIIIAVATAIGLIIGVLCAFVRNALFGGLSEPDDVERYTGLPVLAAIPHSDLQDKLWRRSRRKNATVPALLAQSQGCLLYTSPGRRTCHCSSSSCRTR